MSLIDKIRERLGRRRKTKVTSEGAIVHEKVVKIVYNSTSEHFKYWKSPKSGSSKIYIIDRIEINGTPQISGASVINCHAPYPLSLSFSSPVTLKIYKSETENLAKIIA